MTEIIGSSRRNTRDLIERLESMPFGEAREKILKEEMGNQIGSPNHEICLSWLSLAEAKQRDERENKTLNWARHAAFAAYAAAIIAVISIIVTIVFQFFSKSP